MAAEVALVLVVVGVAIGVHVGWWLARRAIARVEAAKQEAQEWAGMAIAQLTHANRLLDQYAPDRPSTS